MRAAAPSAFTTTQRAKWLPRLGIAASLALVLGGLLVHAYAHARFLSDDALISLRYARQLASGNGLTWNTGERVEGYSDLLWVLLTAAGARVGLDPIACALTLDRIGVASAVAVVGLSPRTGRWSAARLLAGGGLMAASVPLAVWANGGLEQGFMVGVLQTSLFLAERQRLAPRRISVWASAPLAALVLLRLDGALLAGLVVASASWAAARGAERPWRARTESACLLGALPALAGLGQAVFRRAYYGSWEPNTARVKLAVNASRLAKGLSYAGRGYAAMGVLLVAALFATWLLRRQARSTLLLAWTLVVGWTLYLVAIGGDIFPGWRQLVFLFPPLCTLLAEAAERVAERFHRVVFVALAVLPLAVGHVFLQRADGENQRATTERWEWNGLPIGRTLKAAFARERPLLAVDAAGALPYWSELPALDMLGLNDAYIAEHRPASFGQGEIGHELGDGAYVLQRRPDLIAFDNAAGSREPRFLSGRQLIMNPEFGALYEWIRVHADDTIGELWVRREGGPLGIARTADRVAVPGYFVTGEGSIAVAELDGRGRLAGRVSEAGTGLLSGLLLPRGRWTIGVRSPDSNAPAIALRCDGRDASRIDGDADAVELEGGRPIALAVAPPLGQAPIAIEAVVFTRADDGPPSLRCEARGQPVLRSLSALEAPRPEGLPWSHPANVVVDDDGLAATVERTTHVRRVVLTADGNNEYTIELRRHEAVLWQATATRVANRGGLATRRIDVETDDLVAEPRDEVLVKPAGGNGRYGIGRLVLEE